MKRILKIKTIVLIGSALLTLSACGTIPSFPQHHILMFNYHGKPVDPCTFGETVTSDTSDLAWKNFCVGAPKSVWFNKYRKFNDDPKSNIYTDKKEPEFNTYTGKIFDAIDDKFPGNNKKKILIHVHGGLNQRGEALAWSTSDLWGPPLYDVILNSPEGGYFPIFVNWHSGLLSTYGDHLLNVRQGEDWSAKSWYWKAGRYATSPVYLAVDIVRGVVRAPLVWASFFLNEAKTMPVFEYFDPKDAVHVAGDIKCRKKGWKTDPGAPERCVPTWPPTKPEKFIIHTGQDYRNYWDMTKSAAQYTVTLPSKLAVAPMIDSMGTSAWNNMLRRVNLLNNIDDEFHTDRSISQRAWKDPKLGLARTPVHGGLSHFMQLFIERYKSDIQSGNMEIVLVGHSMGTIVLNEMIRNYGVYHDPATGEKWLFNQIVYMAAACTISHYESTVIPYLARNKKAHFYNVMLGRMAEIRENNVLGLSPRGSLLVWIDEFLSNPLTHRDRTLGRYDNFLMAVHNIPESMRDRIHIKSFNTGQKYPDYPEPQEHGDFRNFKFWDNECLEDYPDNHKDCFRKK
ncbi:MAG: hypothetical protein V3R23_04140 [Nitrospinaceae bacterium]